MAYEITLLTTMAIGIIAALSLNLITGFCGQISLGHAAFYGSGAYCAAMSAKNYNSFPEAAEILRRSSGALEVIRRRQPPEAIYTNEVLPEDL